MLVLALWMLQLHRHVQDYVVDILLTVRSISDFSRCHCWQLAETGFSKVLFLLSLSHIPLLHAFSLSLRAPR